MKRFSYGSKLAATLVGAGLIAVPLIGSAQEVQPSIDVSDLTVQCTDDPCTQMGSFTITDVSGDPAVGATILSIEGSIVFISQGGVKTECAAETLVHDAPATIDPGQTVTVTYTITCDVGCVLDAREVQNIVEVSIEGREDKVFRGSGSCILVEDVD